MRSAFAGKSVIVAALVSAKDDAERIVADAAAAIRAGGGTVVGTMVQRRGVSRGGVRTMGAAMSPVVFGTGKAQELAALCRTTEADTVVICRVLTSAQRERLEALVGCPVLDEAALRAS